ncbi:MAG: protein phosphatase 2C domain-containing protein [Hyphomicrobiaceae bacterium]|nr:protein phosphatase 2C domain-containing protein [Hyphomicrobiaceae bacterium]
MAAVWASEAPAEGSGSVAPGPEPACLLAVLADGMGGHAGGALASRIVCDSFIAAFAGHGGPVADRLRDALDSANAAVADRVDADPVLSGMGSTLVAAAVASDGVVWVSVGDSPFYLYRRGEVAQLNQDHSLAPELDRLADLGRITHEEARRDPRRHMLRSAVTGEELDLVDQPIKPLRLEPDDYLILASDGLQTLDTTEIERLVSAYAPDGAAAVASALIRAVEAVRDPHQDNATVIAVRVGGPAA